MTRLAVSAILTTRNRPELLADALRSVERQSHPPLEIRIADDGTPPLATPPEVAGLQVTVVHPAAGRPAVARNVAARGAGGVVLAFLDDDDLWRSDHLAGLAAAFADPAVEFAWRDCAVIREVLKPDGTRLELDRLELARDWDLPMMRDNDYLPPSAWGVRRDLFERLGGFDESFAYSEDWDFALRAAAVTAPRRVAGLTVEVRMRDSGHASLEFGVERLDCLRRLAARHGLPELEPRTFWEVAQHVARAGPPR
ncbi:MAG: glycosyltransferase family A protein [Candidatus Eisenbacteria bacterium]